MGADSIFDLHASHPHTIQSLPGPAKLSWPSGPLEWPLCQAFGISRKSMPKASRLQKILLFLSTSQRTWTASGCRSHGVQAEKKYFLQKILENPDLEPGGLGSHFYCKIYEKNGPRALNNYSASFWTSNFPISLWENPKAFIFMIFGFWDVSMTPKTHYFQLWRH